MGAKLGKEIEAKFMRVDHDAMRKKLKNLSAKMLTPMTDARRGVYRPLGDESTYEDYSFVRVRDEGHRVTITYKRVRDENGIHGVEEIEVEISDFEKACLIVEKLGLEKKSYQETRRETWRLGTVEIMLDEWPHAPPTIEIEGPSEAEVKKVSQQLGFDWSKAVHGSADRVYEDAYDVGHGYDVTGLPELTFDKPLPEEIARKKKF